MPRSLALLMTLFAAAACSPNEILVDLNMTVTNQSGWDYMSTVVCSYDETGWQECSDPFALGSGQTLQAETFVFDVEGAQFSVDAAGTDIDGDIWYSGMRQYTVSGPTLDISVLFTEDDCCW